MAEPGGIIGGTKRLLHRVTPRQLFDTHLSGQVIRRLANKLGLVYFGYVDQKDDEYRLVRGRTASPGHRDDHYTIGTVKGYDVVLVSRSDLAEVNGKARPVNWLIITVDLHTKYDIPHILLGSKKQSQTLRSSYKYLNPVALGAFGSYPADFINNYVVYGAQAHSFEIEKILQPSIAEVIDKHFEGTSVEIDDNVVYLYIENQRPSEALIGKAMSNGLWLAETLDRVTTKEN